ncbi:MAG TPA: SpoIIIAH-like family protein [Sphingobacteriaceae bacterium]|nr:SpoIIIAH-like family protein [Sphingobacteriaceae bacterium]
MIVSARSPVRFIIFILVLALLMGYVLWKWSDLNRPGSPAGVTLPLLAQWAARSGAADTPDQNAATTPLTQPTAGSAAGEEYSLFVDGRLQRDQSRSLRMEVLREMLQDEEVSEEARRAAAEELMLLNRLAAQEADLENLLRAGGFADAVAFLYPEAGVVVVKAETLNQAQAARVAELTARVAGTPLEGISVMARPR